MLPTRTIPGSSPPLQKPSMLDVHVGHLVPPFLKRCIFSLCEAAKISSAVIWVFICGKVDLRNTPYCLEKQIRHLDCRIQYAVMGRRFDTSYPTGRYGVSTDQSEQNKRRAFWSLNEDILKITILKTNTPYPSRKIRRIRACTHQRPQRNKAQYAVLEIQKRTQNQAKTDKIEHGNGKEKDITPKDRKQCKKMTKPDTEWKSCKGQGQMQIQRSISQVNVYSTKSTAKSAAVIEEYYWLQYQPI
ncbi:hypothetical protein Tco_0841080 [Tanacetum coccineum]|uniref:Uncharacterized protein n=1 Tax=Tanacetum coccineum TaxID=301880 RepID=A0ABQ5AZ92_9ASTR